MNITAIEEILSAQQLYNSKLSSKKLYHPQLYNTSNVTLKPVGTTEQINHFRNMLVGSSNTEPVSELINPLDMLHNHIQIMRTMVVVDYTAKIAGTVGQGVNKLVNMQ